MSIFLFFSPEHMDRSLSIQCFEAPPKVANNAHAVRLLPPVLWAAHCNTSESVSAHEAGWRSTPPTRATCGGTETRERRRRQTNEHLLVPLYQTDKIGHFSVGNRHPATHRHTTT